MSYIALFKDTQRRVWDYSHTDTPMMESYIVVTAALGLPVPLVAISRQGWWSVLHKNTKTKTIGMGIEPATHRILDDSPNHC